MNEPGDAKPRDEQALVIRFVAEGGEEQKVYDFDAFPVSAQLQKSFADGFRTATGPAGSRRTVSSANAHYRASKSFAKFLSGLDNVPQTVAELNGHHIHAARLALRGNWFNVRTVLRGTYLNHENASISFRTALRERDTSRQGQRPVHSYTAEHHRIVIRAAKETTRLAFERIYKSRGRVESYRRGEQAGDERDRLAVAFQSEVLDLGYKEAFRPRQKSLVKAGLNGGRLAKELHLSVEEAGAVAVLLVAYTGENLEQILRVSAQHHRADSQSESETPVVLLEMSKPRRGRTGSEMTVPLSGVPAWHDGVLETDVVDLSSAFGVYKAAEYMCSDARRAAGSNRLIVAFGLTRGNYKPVTDNHVYDWNESVSLLDSRGRVVRADTRRLRRTFIEVKQKPVAHSVGTFLDTYLVRDRGNVAAYQKVVATVLEKEVSRALTSVAQIVTSKTIALAASDPDAAAREVGTSASNLKRSLKGELDTVMTSCLDNMNSPYTPVGAPCGASFMLCLGCPNARAEPRHLAVQLLVFDELENKRGEMEAAEWAIKFAIHHARLSNLFSQFPSATVDAARGTATQKDVDLVHRFLARDLDVK